MNSPLSPVVFDGAAFAAAAPTFRPPELVRTNREMRESDRSRVIFEEEAGTVFKGTIWGGMQDEDHTGVTRATGEHPDFLAGGGGPDEKWVLGNAPGFDGRGTPFFALRFEDFAHLLDGEGDEVRSILPERFDVLQLGVNRFDIDWEAA